MDMDMEKEAHISVPREWPDNSVLVALKAIVERHSGRANTYLHLLLPDYKHEAVFLLGDSYRVAPTHAFFAAVVALEERLNIGLNVYYQTCDNRKM